MNGLSINNTWYDVRLIKNSMKRQFTVVSGSNAGTSLAYTEIPDIVGTRIDYTVSIMPNPSNRAAYDNLVTLLSDPNNNYVSVKMPGLNNSQTLSFNARVLTGTDTLAGNYVVGNGNVRLWEGLTVTFRAIAPQRMAT